MRKLCVDNVSGWWKGTMCASRECGRHANQLADRSTHENEPPDEQLHVPLGGVDQRVQFRADARLDDVLATVKGSKLTAFFKLCDTDDFARTLLYLEAPKFYTWNTGGQTGAGE